MDNVGAFDVAQKKELDRIRDEAEAGDEADFDRTELMQDDDAGNSESSSAGSHEANEKSNDTSEEFDESEVWSEGGTDMSIDPDHKKAIDNSDERF